MDEGATGKSAFARTAPSEAAVAAAPMAGELPRKQSRRTQAKPLLAVAGLLLVMLVGLLRTDVLLEDLSKPDVVTVTRRRPRNRATVDIGNNGGAVFKELDALSFDVRPQAYVANASLPRSSSRPYNKIDPAGRYLMYTPSGGFNNQLICLLTGIYLAKEYNRTLIVPPNGRHRNFFNHYYDLDLDEVVPMDQSVDLDFMERENGVPLLPINTTMRHFLKHDLGEQLKPSDRLDLVKLNSKGLTKGSKQYHTQIFERGLSSKAPVLWFHGRFYTHRFEAQSPGLRRKVRFAPFLRAFSKAVADNIFDGKPFNAIHIRMGDKFKKEGVNSRNAAVFLRRARAIGFDRDTPVYLATDGDPDDRYYAPARKWFKHIYFQRDLARNDEVRKWVLRFAHGTPGEAIRFDLFGLVEQLICVRSTRFVGSLHSTFSKTISKQRLNLERSLPDLYAKIGPDTEPRRGSVLVNFLSQYGYPQFDEQKTMFGPPRGSRGGGKGASRGADGADGGNGDEADAEAEASRFGDEDGENLMEEEAEAEPEAEAAPSEGSARTEPSAASAT